MPDRGAGDSCIDVESVKCYTYGRLEGHHTARVDAILGFLFRNLRFFDDSCLVSVERRIPNFSAADATHILAFPPAMREDVDTPCLVCRCGEVTGGFCAAEEEMVGAMK